MPDDEKREEYLAMNTKEDRSAAIEDADSVEELDAMAAAWRERGMSPQGQTMARVTARKVELGHEPTAEEANLIRKAAKRRKENSKLPPIEGSLDLSELGS